jgi:hypothetical protein
VGGHGWKPAERGEACARWWRCSGVLLLPSLQWRRRRRGSGGAVAAAAAAAAGRGSSGDSSGGGIGGGGAGSSRRCRACFAVASRVCTKCHSAHARRGGCARLLTISHRWPRGRPGNAGAQICLVHRYNRSLLRTTAEFRRHWFTVARASSLEPIARPPRAQYPAAIHGAAPISASFCRGAKLASAS